MEIHCFLTVSVLVALLSYILLANSCLFFSYNALVDTVICLSTLKLVF